MPGRVDTQHEKYRYFLRATECNVVACPNPQSCLRFFEIPGVRRCPIDPQQNILLTASGISEGGLPSSPIVLNFVGAAVSGFGRLIGLCPGAALAALLPLCPVKRCGCTFEVPLWGARLRYESPPERANMKGRAMFLRSKKCRTVEQGRAREARRPSSNQLSFENSFAIIKA